MRGDVLRDHATERPAKQMRIRLQAACDVVRQRGNVQRQRRGGTSMPSQIGRVNCPIGRQMGAQWVENLRISRPAVQ